LKTMILAAGKGERMRPLTLETPKPLLQAGGKSLIEHQIRHLARNGFTDLVINHAWLGCQIESALGNGDTLGVTIEWSREEEPLETAGGIVKALSLLGDKSFLCTNADIWTDFPYDELKAVDGDELLAWLVLVDNPVHHPGGDFVLEGSKIRKPVESEKAMTFSGIAVYHPALFAGLSPASRQPVAPLLTSAIEEGKVGGQHYGGHWFDIGTPERLQALDDYLGLIAH